MATSDGDHYFVYILTNSARNLYVGTTGDLALKMQEHKNGLVPGISSRYKMTVLAYYEKVPDVWSAVERENEIKEWSRVRLEALVNSMNPEWKDLSEDWD